MNSSSNGRGNFRVRNKIGVLSFSQSSLSYAELVLVDPSEHLNVIYHPEFSGLNQVGVNATKSSQMYSREGCD